MLTDQETGHFSEREFSDPEAIRELIRSWILLDFYRYTPASQEKIRNTLAFYLATRSDKLEWIFPSFAIPLNVPTAHLFYSLVWEALYKEAPPVDIDKEKYEECERLSFINSLEKTMESGSTEEEYPFPERKGLILPERLNRHHSGLSLPSRSNGSQPVSCPITRKPCPLMPPAGQTLPIPTTYAKPHTPVTRETGKMALTSRA